MTPSIRPPRAGFSIRGIGVPAEKLISQPHRKRPSHRHSPPRRRPPQRWHRAAARPAGQSLPARGKKRPPGQKTGKNGISHNGGHDAGQDGLEFEFCLPVKHFRSEQRRPQGRPEDGANARGGPGQDQDAPVPGISFKIVARKDPKPAPIWAMGPSLPAEPPLPMVMAEAIIFTNGTRLRI